MGLPPRSATPEDVPIVRPDAVKEM
jgi:hypothetical protein